MASNINPYLLPIKDIPKHLLQWREWLETRHEVSEIPFSHEEDKGVINSLLACSQQDLSLNEDAVILNLKELSKIYDDHIEHAVMFFKQRLLHKDIKTQEDYAQMVLNKLFGPRLSLGGLPTISAMSALRDMINEAGIRRAFSEELHKHRFTSLNFFNLGTLSGAEYTSIRDQWIQAVPQGTPIKRPFKVQMQEAEIDKPKGYIEKPDLEKIKKDPAESLIIKCLKHKEKVRATEEPSASIKDEDGRVTNFQEFVEGRNEKNNLNRKH